MPQFLAGDEVGSIKTLRYNPSIVEGTKAELKILRAGDGKAKAVQALAVHNKDGDMQIASGHADGSAYHFVVKDDKTEIIHEWKEHRLTPKEKYVGLEITDKGIFSCTSNGALLMMSVNNEGTFQQPEFGSLPTCLCDWHLSPDGTTLAYGGDEVDISVWNTEQAFSSRAKDTPIATGKKRKRQDDLFPAEIWRAKNIPNDFLGLRQPVHITSLAYLSSSPSTSQHHLIAGTKLGDIRRYDTRAARKPVAHWKDVGKGGGVKLIKKGLAEHELFVADYDCNLFSIDLRNGRMVYGYKGISGTVTSMAPSPSILASTALDRYSRIHSTFPPPPQSKNLEKRGQVLEKIYMTSIPSVIVWDQDSAMDPRVEVGEGDDKDDGDDIWDKMEDVDDENVVSKRKQTTRDVVSV